MEIFDLFLVLLFIPLFLTFHELGHYVAAKKYKYQPCAILLKWYIFPTAVITIVKETKTIYKLSGLISLILAMPLLLPLLIPSYIGVLPERFSPWIILSIIYLLGSIYSAKEDIRYIWEDYREIEKEKEDEKENINGDVLVTAREKWEKWKVKYPEFYEEIVEKEFILPWAK